MSAELLPCPLCGGATITDTYIRDGRSVGCIECGCSVHAYNPKASEKCANLWNTRAPGSVEDVSARLTASQERERVLREALEPFAVAANVRLCADDGYWTDEKSIQGTDVSFHVKFGDLRRARAALSQVSNRENGDG